MQEIRDETRLRQHIDDLEVKRRQLKVLNEFAISLMTIGSIEELLWHAAREVVANLGFVDCVIYRLDPDEKQLTQTAASGAKNPEHEQVSNQLVIPVGSGITGAVAKTCQPIIVQDAASDPRFIRDLAPSQSEICVPITVDGKLFGVIDCEDPGKSAFDENHLEILTTVAAMTASKISQCETVDQQAHQSEIIQRVSEMVIIADNEGKIIDCNPATERIYEVERKHILGLNIFRLYEQRNSEDAMRPEAVRSLKRQESWSSRVPLTDNDGDRRFFDISVTPIVGPGGETDRFVTVGREVTKQVEAERSLQERNQVLQDMGFELRDALEQSRIAQRTQAAFLANVSHELRTPLNAIVGFSDIIQQTDVLNRAPEKVIEYNQYIHSAGQHLTSLVNDILDISSLAANESEVSRDRIAIPEMLETCRTLVNHKAQKKEIIINTAACSNAPDVIFDSRHFKQIFTNLLDNAIKFSPGASTITLAVAGDESDGILVSVADEGRGIEEAQLESIFTAFSRADWVRSQEVEGAGLGLALVNEMVSINGCEVSVSSDAGAGAVFTVHIPADRIVKPGDAGEDPEADIASHT